MDYSRKKLPLEAAHKLIEEPIESLQAFRLMYSPVYLFFKENKKFVSIKAPLDFFNQKELEQIRSYKSVFFSDFLQSIKPLQEAASKVREIMRPPMDISWKDGDKGILDLELNPIPFEISNEVLKVVGPLWWENNRKDIKLEPFHVAVFVNELCAEIPPENLIEAREKSVATLEESLFLSSWVVFLALHLSYCEIDFLNDLRVQVFKAKCGHPAVQSSDKEIRELIKIVSISLEDPQLMRSFNAVFFEGRTEKVSKKLRSRLDRIRKEFLSRGEPPSIFGDEGFIDE